MTLVVIPEKMKTVAMMHRVTGQWGGRTNKSDQAATSRSQRTSFERSFRSGRAGAEQHEASPVGQNCFGLYFPVNSSNAASQQQDAPPGHSGAAPAALRSEER